MLNTFVQGTGFHLREEKGNTCLSETARRRVSRRHVTGNRSGVARAHICSDPGRPCAKDDLRCGRLPESGPANAIEAPSCSGGGAQSGRRGRRSGFSQVVPRTAERRRWVAPIWNMAAVAPRVWVAAGNSAPRVGKCVILAIPSDSHAGRKSLRTGLGAWDQWCEARSNARGRSSCLVI